jgi:hypothetical protein
MLSNTVESMPVVPIATNRHTFHKPPQVLLFDCALAANGGKFIAKNSHWQAELNIDVCGHMI